MPYLAGLVSGVLLTILVVFMVDTFSVADQSGSETRKIVNWDVAAQKLSSSFATVKEEVHEATR